MKRTKSKKRKLKFVRKNEYKKLRTKERKKRTENNESEHYRFVHWTFIRLMDYQTHLNVQICTLNFELKIIDILRLRNGLSCFDVQANLIVSSASKTNSIFIHFFYDRSHKKTFIFVISRRVCEIEYQSR